MTDEPLTQQTLEMLEALEMLKSRFMARICRKSWTTSERKGGNKLRRVEIGSDLPAVPKKIPFLELIAAGVTPVLQAMEMVSADPDSGQESRSLGINMAHGRVVRQSKALRGMVAAIYR